MPPAFHKALCVAIIFFATGCEVRAQSSEAKRTEADFSNDPCGNPLVESNAWVVLKGKVSRVIDGRTIMLATQDGNRVLQVQLAGITLESQGSFSEEAKTFLEKSLLYSRVEVMVLNLPDERTRKITAMIWSPDVGLSLLTKGLVRFTAPALNTSMSSYMICKYRQAEAEAASKKIGLWQSSNRS